ncbi:LAS superfamily LD-carboxypeptidase LdcB [Caulobacter ginsengisoli]|uniref:LAS superfamily LD-carboxypeptidase LdcB n=1 Tax=Caulobacter ginsengisoli TaxID=400775 RepID=A0ABU0IQR6_9CAUL|nr:D-alanyl-D-alanine carboxypeptidase family protein [Caulobacter ginsengisoli]MDQ0463364.1 LAS superfamily LD-carboxypeptidase LdcB [Caulobacter ginsengisoli]
MKRFLWICLIAGLGLGGFLWWSNSRLAPEVQAATSARLAEVRAAPNSTLTLAGGPGVVSPCIGRPRFATAASQNAMNLNNLAWSPFRRPEMGWRTYAPMVASEIGSDCPYDSQVFADRLAGWQAAHGLPASGVLDAASFDVMRVIWHRRRPFVQLSRSGCPAAPDPASLATIPATMTYGSRPMLLRADALAALKRMTADARAADPAIARDRQALLVFSAFRAPVDDDLRCLTEGNCDNIGRTTCSAHRTGLAVDIVVGARPGGRVDSAEDANRRFQSQTPAYRWLVRNARRYGFVPYVYEPWHWEWAGAGLGA